MGYPSPQGSPNLSIQVAYNEFRYQSQSPQPNSEFDDNDIRPDPDFIAETQEVSETQDVPDNEAPSRSRGKKPEQTTTRDENTKWTPKENVALAMGWVAISEDGQIENAQPNYSFGSVF